MAVGVGNDKFGAFIHSLLHTPKPADRAEMIRLAQTECELRGWAWVEPVRVAHSIIGWRITTNANGRGGNAVFTLDRAGRKIISAQMLPR